MLSASARYWSQSQFSIRADHIVGLVGLARGAYWYRWVPGMGTYANQRQNKRNVHILWHCCGVQSSTMGYNIGYIQSPSFGTAAVAVAAALVVDRLMSSN